MRKKTVIIGTVMALATALSVAAFGQKTADVMHPGFPGKSISFTPMKPAELQKMAGPSLVDYGKQLTTSSYFKLTTDFSPDGKWITYAQMGDDGLYDVWIVPTDGGKPIDLTATVSGSCYYPTFRNDSKTVMYTLLDTTGTSLWNVAIDTLQKNLVMKNAANGQWSHNDQYLALRTGDLGGLWIFDKKNIKTWEIDTDPSYGLSCFSPDDSYVITTRSDGALWKIPVIGGVPVQVTPSVGAQWYPVMSPDGRWLLFTIWPVTIWQNAFLAALDITTGDFIAVFPDMVTQNYCASFSTDGSRISYLQVVDGVFQVFVAPNPLEAKTITITSPNGGESLTAGTVQTITWEGPATAKVEFSSDGGSNWITLPATATATPNAYEWNIPAALTSNRCLVRVTNLAGDVSDVSDGVFTIAPAATGKITVIAPNGGERWPAGSTQQIVWEKTGVENSVAEFSLDGGTTWAEVSATSIVVSPTIIKWVVPDVTSDKCLVRVSDDNNRIVFDVSDGVFTITPAAIAIITVTAPNGGENWTAGTTQNITWTSTGVANVNIEYSTNNGTTWNTIIESTEAEADSYTWAVPATINSTNCKIRITAVVNTSVTDMSDAVFTIAPAVTAKITVTAPNGGEVWTAGTTQNITWDGVATANIEFSPDSGSTWETLPPSVTAVANRYSWKIPDANSTKCLVRVSDTRDAKVSDVSDGLFTISPAASIAVTSPNGGESWTAGTTQNITWTSTGVANVTIEYSVNNGSSWAIVISSGYPSPTAAASGSYPWMVPSTINSTNCKVRVSDAADTSVSDVSDAVFTIAPAVTAKITVTSPNGGEHWTAGTTHNITWTWSVVTNVKLEYSTDNGSSWTSIIASTAASTGSNPWMVPNVSSTQCLVRVSDASNAAVTDKSDAVFSIVPAAKITVTSPNGGESWTAGTSQNITWTSSGVTSVKLEYSTDGSNWPVITTTTSASAGSYTWAIPATLNSTTCKVRVTDALNTSVSDTSDGVFTIAPAAKITVTSPNGGETLYVGETFTIRWNSVGVSQVHIVFSPDAGNTAEYIAVNVDATLGKFEWVVPDSVTSTALIVLVDASNDKIIDGNDEYFSIILPSITLLYPNGRETLKTGDKVTIRWEAFGLGNIEIIYSTDDFATWQYITPSVDASKSSHVWTVPDINSSTVLIALGDANYLDISDGYFTVSRGTKPYLQVTSPNGGESWAAGTSKIISWSSANSTAIRIEYSTDGGNTWKLVNAGANSAAGTYSWPVPNDVSANCKVRIIDTTDTSVIDMSDGAFSIIESTAAFITVVSPTANDRWTVGSKKEIKWEFSGIKGVLIELSADGGGLWEKVVENPTSASSGTYTWTVPDKKSKQCMIRVSDTAVSTVFGKSGTFEILQPELVINHTPVTEAQEGDKITFTATVTGSADLNVELRYNETGLRQFDKFKTMTKSGDNMYSCTFEGGLFTAEGMEYFIVARDVNNVSLRANAPDKGYYCIRARVKNMLSLNIVTGGSAQNAYRMVSIPLQLENTAITEQTGVIPKGEMGTGWRLFRFSPGENEPKEYPNIEGFAPGIAFWLIAKSDFQLQSPEGSTVSSADPFTIELKPGWNDIANPWMFDISWNDIENPSSANLSKPYSYGGSWSDPSTSPLVLNPWKGYAVKNLENRNVVIRLLPNPVKGVAKEALPESDLLWKLTLTAQAGLARDSANHVGVCRDASAEWDGFDAVEPPVIGEYVSIAFPHHDWARYPSDYTIDVRPPNSVIAWDFDVRTNISHEKVHVVLDGINDLPAGYVAPLFDRDSGKPVTLSGGSFEFASGNGVTQRHFALVVSTGGDTGRPDTGAQPEKFVTASCYPNPFNPSTTIRYELSMPGHVKIAIFNAIGQKIRDYDLGFSAQGIHEFVFDAAGLTTGLYLYRVDSGYAAATEKMLFMK